MITLENAYLRATISSAGAELTSLYDKENETERLWKGDPDYWGRHAPHLFPVVGGCINNELLIDGKTYPMPKHGFARDSQFKRMESTPEHAKYSLRWSDETLKAYPYKFEFQVLYDLFERDLRVTYKVINLDAGTVYFQVGGHPAFNVPLLPGESFDDYYIEFEKAEPLETHLLAPSGYFSGETGHVALDGNKLWLKTELFDTDALVFKNMQSRRLSIRSKNHDQVLSVDFPQFNYLGIWTKAGGAPFVCIEPWLGCADTDGPLPDIREKDGIQHVRHGHVVEAVYTISVAG
ncbi:MAG: aldose 1-epimerase family protein [Mucilaginibacter polytrichastri]|nr:aldose 1-epimerase family protein [Mucilaginibacter polytrichastri]